MISTGLRSFKGKRVLMLQGPVGPFFSRLATDLSWAGADVYKVNFNGGDWLFSRSGLFSDVFNYTGTLNDWLPYYSDLMHRLNIDTVLLFGDCRPIHAQVVQIAQQRGAEVGVFEEGYLRPDYITLERDGVNNHSSLPDSPNYYLDHPPIEAPITVPLGSTFGMAAMWAMMYYAAASLLKPFFRHYQHHRWLSWLEGLFWVRSYLRKRHYQRKEQAVMPLLTGEQSGRFFLVALQTRGDAQISAHSNFESVEAFIGEVVDSFARGAPPGVALVIKHHPLDRGQSDYTRFIDGLVQQHRLAGRCHYIHDQHLPTLLEHASGVVVINSTVGLSAVGESVPTKVCGEAIFDIQGLTFKGSLDTFWSNAHLGRPNPELFRAFKNYLVSRTQHNGSFYKRLRVSGHATGVVWTDRETNPLQLAERPEPLRRQRLR